MSNYQDIQKLRINKAPQMQYTTGHRFSQPSQPEIYNINIDRFMGSGHSQEQMQVKQSYPIKFY